MFDSNGVGNHDEDQDANNANGQNNNNVEPPKKKICVTIESFRAPRVEIINIHEEEIFEGY